ncbi:hypothetical protein [Janthinobacterium sp. SUN206]|uniref:hypothetical protein n=1 Tax=Janthinobacterium sp. SUN206 TaxID=3014787 RepID=UPI00271384FA|nr:hypothetical protein [Janthinobacterium sp. SUN206]MDO8064843.1 hypothetical protein [Janthinobacterium sp. SUN206]
MAREDTPSCHSSIFTITKESMFLRNSIRRLAVLVLMMGSAIAADIKKPIQHYLYFSHRELNGENIRSDKALNDARFRGAQIVYTWRSLEPQQDRYDFSAIRHDIAFLDSIGKKLWIQLQEKSFTPRHNVPAYLLSDPRYQGGIIKQSMLSAPERDPHKPVTDDEYGWSPKMWEQPVRDRYQRLIRALGQEFDGKIEGINFSESSIDIGVEDGKGNTIFPDDFKPQQYVDAIKENMRVLAGAFPHTNTMVYLNFLPGEWLPWSDKGYMRSVFAQAQTLHMGVGGPDLMPYRKSHMGQSYGFIKDYPADLVKGMAVQDGNLRQINPRTGKKNSVEDVLDFARNYLGLDYIFWVEDEPYFSNEVLIKLPAH